MTKFAYFIAVVLFCLSSHAAEYFVDSQKGSDTGDGLSPEQAWQSLKAVNEADLQPGDTVRFKCGGQWRGQLRPRSGEEGKPVTYTFYGDGEKPSLLGSVPLNELSDWQPAPEQSGVWVTRQDSLRLAGVVEDFHTLEWSRHHEGGAKVILTRKPQDSFPDLPEAKEYTMTCETPGTQPNHIQLIVHGFPVTAGDHYLFRFEAKSTKPFRIAAIGFSEPGSPWRPLGSVIRRPDEIGGDWHEHTVLFRCDQSHADARLTLSLGGSMPEGAVFAFIPKKLESVLIDSAGIDTDVGNIILDGEKAAFKKWTLADLTNEDDFLYEPETSRVWYRSKDNPAGRFKSVEVALHRHVVDHSNCRYVIFDGLDIRYGAAHGFGGTKVSHCIYRNLDISWIGGADQYKEGGAGRRVRFGNGIEFWSDAENCLVEHCRLWEIYDAALTNQGAGVNVERNLLYRNNAIRNCEYSFEYWNRGPESVTDNIVFEKNVCTDAGFGWGHVQRSDPNGRHVMIYANTAKTTNFVIRDNVFQNATESLVRIDADFRDGMTMEGNLYRQPNGGELFRWLNKDRFTSLEEYQEKTGLDKTSHVEPFAGE